MESEKYNADLSRFHGMIENLPCGFFIAQAQKPYRLLYANDEMLRLFDCRDLRDFCRYIEQDVRNIVAVNDRERVGREIGHDLQAKSDRFEHVRSHLFTRESRIRYADVSGRLVETEEFGPVFYCTLQEIDIPQPGQMVDRDIRDYVVGHLDEAIANQWIQVYYQPVIRTLTGELCGMEALARWVDPHVGFLSPAAFIPVLEQVRLIYRLDSFVLEEACRIMRQRMDEGLPITPVSVNLSRYDFDLMDVCQVLEQTRQKYSLPRDFLHVEITESALAQDSAVMHQTIDRLREEGYEVWLDDFGSGYSSLNILKDYNIDLIKLDMGFLRSFTDASRSIVTAVITMAKELGIKTLAEGVETKEHADFLASIGCGRQQGYFYGKPQPIGGTLAHIESEGRGIEPRKWCHYYDVASMFIRQTDRACALFDRYGDGHVHCLYANKTYGEQIHELGYQLQDIEENLGHPETAETVRTFWAYVDRSRKSGQMETYFYIDGGDYVNTALQVVCEMNQHLLIYVEIQNLSQSNAGRRQSKLDENLRYLYTMFEDVYLVHIRQDRMERLYAHTSFSQPSLQGPVHGISQTVRRVAQNYVYEDDRERYLAFFDADTIVGRIRKSTSGRISCRFRMRDRHGNYNWRECAVVLLSNGNDPAVMVAARMADQPAALPETPHTAGSGLSELLWRNFCRNTPFCYFWKDRQRRFLGATKAFLRHYGFESEQVILGKTDEDLNWHVDNDLYRLDEIDVLRTGRVVENVPGECIVKGGLHHITCYKWPLYQGGQIIGLLGVFFDADDMYRGFGQDRPSPYEDSVTRLRNRQGFLGALLSYHEAYTVQHQPFCLILFESRSDDLLKESYEPMILRSLACEEARCLREIAGKDSVIARIKEFDFAILHRETQPQESERMARRIQEKLQGIHRIGGTPVTITFRYSIVHADEPDVRKAVRRNAANLYRLAMRRLRSGGSEEAGK